MRNTDVEGVDSKRESNGQLQRLEWRVYQLEEKTIQIHTILERIENNNLVRYDRQIDRSATLMNRIVWAVRLCALCFMVGVFL